MYNFSFSHKAQIKLDVFINSILEKNLKIFDDCGIENAAFIEQSYLSHSELLREEILGAIKERTKLELIGSSEKHGKKYFAVQVLSFRLFIYYSQNDILKFRYIENIEFRKR